jgi:sulfite reductase alpha subunit-like flavoprotein
VFSFSSSSGDVACDRQFQLFVEEMKAAQSAGVISQYETAISRALPTGKGQHVQDILAAQKTIVISVIEEGHIYVCGNSNMGAAVKDVIEQIVSAEVILKLVMFLLC